MKRFRQAFLLSRAGSVELLSEIHATGVVRMLFEINNENEELSFKMHGSQEAFVFSSAQNVELLAETEVTCCDMLKT